MAKLTDSELSNITGGVLTPEAQDWVNRNLDEITRRAPAFLRGFVDTAMDFVSNDAKVYSVDDLKTLLQGYNVNAWDLD